MTKIKFSSISKTYGATRAVDNIDLDVRAGECLALVGHNGAGKSTLIKMLLGLVRPTGGAVQVMGQDPMAASFNHLRRHMGFLPEQMLFQNNMTGRETLEFYARLKGTQREELDDLLRRVDILAAANDPVATYSKGMRQRLGLAQALIGQPELLILDEPTSGLDPASRRNVYAIIDAAKKAGATILISSHALTELDSRIDRVAILNRGKLAAVGTIADLRRDTGLLSDIVIHAPPDSLTALGAYFEGGNVTNGAAHFSCPGDQKVLLLKKLLDMNIPMTDIEVNDPSLEQVFMAYTRGGGPDHE